MGSQPFCDEIGMKKGPWTSEEDIILFSYIRKHGPGNWRSVPSRTGLMRASKSCRLRWTNYLRPGIRLGNFTAYEERMIIHLQSLLGNKWAAIASYLPQRTDNDIKNLWNTHLKKKMKKPEYQMDSPVPANVSSSSAYASSTDNISRLLEGWMSRPSPHATDNIFKQQQQEEEQPSIKVDSNSANIPQGEFESMLAFGGRGDYKPPSTTANADDYSKQQQQQQLMEDYKTTLSLLDEWLQVGDMMEMEMEMEEH